MQLTTVLLGLVGTALAAPAMEARDTISVSAMAQAPQWAIKSFTRTCNKADTSCKVTFAVDTQTGAPATSCSYTVTGTPASRAPTNGITCGPYTLSSAWSGHFGEGNGFTTWSLVDWSKKQIVWPAYADWELVNGKAVVPDKSYAPQTLA